MDIVLGVSLAPETVRMVLVEGVGAGGITVDQDDFDVTGSATDIAAAADRVIAAILGTRESAAEGGYQLLSSGVTWTDQVEAAALRDALAARKIENVMLVSAFMAAAALAQAVGSATNCAHRPAVRRGGQRNARCCRQLRRVDRRCASAAPGRRR